MTAVGGREGGTAGAVGAFGVRCAVPLDATDRVQLGHGSGGRMSASLIARTFVGALDNPALAALGDGAVVDVGPATVIVSTDSFVVTPLEFPGGNIGSLAVHGTLNDIAMMGARPVCLTAGFVLEEGLPLGTLDRVVAAMAGAARAAGVPVVAGDTKVVERGKADGMYVNTTGVGLADPAFRPGPALARPGDAVIVSGAIGRHGMAIMAAREGLAFESAITSDSACLVPLVDALKRAAVPVHVLRDPTRGGVASALNEIAQASGVGIELLEGDILVPDDVRATCEMLGLDPLYVANEGVMLAIVPDAVADAVVDVLRAHPLGAQALRIGRVVAQPSRTVFVRTGLGGTRIVDLLPGDQLPRIC
ncbi:MAG: hydrogenase expression/formation protein HypE [Gemmatimonadota bacterium]|nr:hydrogenase expression/formation protein HypE [Gemmatimonadota bacterium]